MMPTTLYTGSPWKHPNRLVRAMYFKSEMRMQLAILEELPSRFITHARDVASDAYLEAKEQYAANIREAWSTRRLNRLADSHSNTQNEAA